MATAGGVIVAADFVRLAGPQAYPGISAESAGLPVPQQCRASHPDASGPPHSAERLSDCVVRRLLVPHSSHSARAFAQRSLSVLTGAAALACLGTVGALLVAMSPAAAMLGLGLEVSSTWMLVDYLRHRLTPRERSWLLTDEQPGDLPLGLLRRFGGISRQGDVDQLLKNLQACGILRAEVRHGTQAVKSLEGLDMALAAMWLHGGRKLTSAERRRVAALITLAHVCAAPLRMRTTLVEQLQHAQSQPLCCAMRQTVERMHCELLALDTWLADIAHCNIELLHGMPAEAV